MRPENRPPPGTVAEIRRSVYVAGRDEQMCLEDRKALLRRDLQKGEKIVMRTGQIVSLKAVSQAANIHEESSETG